MSKRILSLMLSFMMVFSMLVAVPVTAATYEATDLKVVPDKTTAAPGDVITYSVVMGPVSDLGSMQMVLDIPAGLTYVPSSGAVTPGLISTLGFDTFDWTEVSLMINGGASAADYASDADTTLGTFQVTVDDNATGTLSVGLTELEFYSCQTWDDNTARFTAVPTPVTIGSGSGSGEEEEEKPFVDYELRIVPDKKEAVAGDTINFEVVMGPVKDLGSMQMVLDISEGLTYVPGSGSVTSGLITTLGFDTFDWTEVSLMINGGASAADYSSDAPTVLGKFQCTVDTDFDGSASVGLTELEFYSCQTWEDLTELYTVTPATIKSPAGVETPLQNYELRVSADKTDALPGDVINFTVKMGPVQNLGSLQMQLDIPKGLEYVPGSGTAVATKEDLGFDTFDWTEETLVINGGASKADYASTTPTVLATFQCKAADNFSGVKEVGLTYLEFYSCQTWEDFTELYFVTPAVINGPVPTTSTLTFVTDGSAVPAVEEIEPGTTIDLSAYTTSKDGYRFMGWYTEDTYENLVTSVTVDSDTTVYAKFLKEYKLTYYVDEAVNEEVIGTEGQVITLKDVPAKSGYDVLGWFVDNAGEAVKEVTLNSDVNVYAKYEYIPIQYTVTFMVDGEEYGTFKVGEGRTLVLANAIENPTKAGYRFDGWALNGAIVTEVYGDGDKTVEAQFVKQYTLTYTAAGFEAETETVDVNTVIDLSTKVPEKEFYIFTGWTLEGAVVTSVTMDADKEVVATYVDAEAIVDDVEYASFAEAFAALADGSEMKFYKDLTTDAPVAINNDVEIDLNGKKVTSSADEAFEINADATIKNGAIDADGVAVAVKAAATVAIEDVDVKANTAISVADAAAEVTVDADSTIEAADAALALSAAGKVALNAPVTGKVIGAYTAGATITTTNEDVADAMDAEGFIVNGGNVAGEARTLTFVTGAGNIEAPAAMRIVKDTVVNLNAITLNPTGYDFAGWYSDANFTTELDSIQVTDDATVYAKFETVLTFDTMGGTTLSEETFVKGETVDLTTFVTTRENATFKGWFTDVFCTVPAGNSIVINAHTKIYAGWQKNLNAGDAQVPYVITAVANPNAETGEMYFNGEETVYVDYVISSRDAEVQTLGSFQFEIAYDKSMLQLVGIEGKIGNADGVLFINETTGRVSFDVDGGKEALDITGGKIVATAIFAVTDGVNGVANVGFKDGAVAEVTPQGYDKNGVDCVLIGATFDVKDIVVTFTSGDNAEFTASTGTISTFSLRAADADIHANVNYGVPGFIDVGFEIPSDKLLAGAGYRLHNDTLDEPLWKNELTGDTYTTAQLKNAAFTENTVLTAQVIKTYVITLEAENGTLEGTKEFVVDTGTTVDGAYIKKNVAVTLVANPGYKFDRYEGIGEITADTTIKAIFVPDEYVLTTSSVPANVATVDGVIDGQTIMYGVPVEFTIIPVENVEDNVKEVGYIIDGVKTPLTPDSNGKYIIPGEAIVGNVDIYAIGANVINVIFVAGENGEMKPGVTYPINKAASITQEILNDVETKVLPDDGYKFVGYAIGGKKVSNEELLNKTIYDSLTVTVLFDHETYTLTDVNGVDVEVTHGTDFTFTPDVPGHIVINVTGVYSDGTSPVEVKKNDDGSYTIKGKDIIDDITLTAEKVAGKIRFILNRQYRALKGRATDDNVKIAVLDVDGGKIAGQKFAYVKSGEDFFWSSRYNAYVYIVDGLTEEEGDTEAIVLANLKLIPGDAPDVKYDGDMNGDGKVTASDAMIITDILHQQRKVGTTFEQMLKADVTDATVDAIERVTTADVDHVRKAAQNS